MIGQVRYEPTVVYEKVIILNSLIRQSMRFITTKVNFSFTVDRNAHVMLGIKELLLVRLSTIEVGLFKVLVKLRLRMDDCSPVVVNLI